MLGIHTGFGTIGRMTFSHPALTGAVQPDTVSPHDSEALAALARHWDQVRLPNLIRGAARSRDLAGVHRGVAREAIRAARAARARFDDEACRSHRETAHDALAKARQCLHFARRCERKAQAIILSEGCSAVEN